MKQHQIFAIGGRFCVDAWEPPLLQRHLLSLSSARSPRICLLAGAVGDNPTAIEQFYREIGIHNCRPTHLNIYKPVTHRDLLPTLLHDNGHHLRQRRLHPKPCLGLARLGH